MKKKLKYHYFKDGMTYTVSHKERKVETFICLTDTCEKADFITKACSQFDFEKYEMELVNNNKEVVTN